VEEAASELFEGDVDAQHFAEAEVDLLVRHWLMWFSTECAEPPAMARLDFLISFEKTAEGSRPGISVWTTEVSECGGTLCGLKGGIAGRNAAALNFAMRYDQSGRFPKPLPPLRSICE